MQSLVPSILLNGLSSIRNEERITAIRKSDTYSSDLLADLLSESNTINKAFYGVTTGLNGATGIASSALALSGIGAPIAAAVGLIGGAISAIVGAFESVALEGLADRYADKLRTDEDGNPQSIDDFFAGSFEHKQDQVKEHYTKFFSDLVEDESIDQVIALGGQGLDATDTELLAFTKTAPELTKTAQNFVETFTDDGWQEGEHALQVTPGQDINLIQLADAGDTKQYLTFTTPLFSAGTEQLSRDETGKNEYETTLTIDDLSGWRIRDAGDNETTFNLSKLVTSAQRTRESSSEITAAADLRTTIEAGGGDDTLFSYEAEVNFHGGEGTDTASYTRLSTKELTSGINVRVLPTGNGPEAITVDKHIAAGSKTYEETIGSRTTHPTSKRTETVEYRNVSLVERDSEIQNTDILYGVEILHGTSLSDTIDLAASREIQQVFGFGGDDVIRGGEETYVISGGNGNDYIQLALNPLATALYGAENPGSPGNSTPYIDGGNGVDILEIHQQMYTHAIYREYERQLEREKVAASVADTLISTETDNYQQELASVTESLTKIFRNNDSDAYQQVALYNTEFVKIGLNGEGQSNENTIISLTEHRDALNTTFVNVNTEDNTTGEVNIFASAADSETAVAYFGTDYTDMIEGSDHNDYLYGGNGNDIFHESNGNDVLVGGAGADIYIYDDKQSGSTSGRSNNSGHDVITGPRPEDIGIDRIQLSDALREKAIYFRHGDDLVIGLDVGRTITIQDAYLNTRIQIDRIPDFNFGYYSSRNGVNTDAIKADYIAFRENTGWDALNSLDTKANTGLGNSLGLVKDNENGGAKVNLAELSELIDIANITNISRNIIDRSQTPDSLNPGVFNHIDGNDEDNTLIGGQYRDIITAGAGDDIILSGADDDKIDGGDGFDIASFAQGVSVGINADLRRKTVFEGDIVENTYENFVSGDANILANIEGLIGTEFNDVLTGDYSDNFLQGGNGVDTISGNAGNDVIHGGLGLDILDGGAGFDIASYAGAAYAIKFDLNGDQSEFYLYNGNYLAGDTVSNFEGVIGTGLADRLIGNEFNNYLSGSGGADHISGGAGNDIIHGGHGLDTLDGGEGFDIASYEGAQFAIRFDLNGSQTEQYQYQGRWYNGDNVSGFEGVIGTSHNDVFIGDSENNYFVGGAGNDQFTGGEGSDTFIFKGETGDDIIHDYTVGEDVLVYDTDEEAEFEKVGDDVRIAFSDDSSVILQGVDYNEFLTEDSLFV